MKSAKKYHSFHSYEEAIEVFDRFAVLILFSFAEHGAGTKNVIIRNFIARTNASLKAIRELWKLKDYQDCWIIYRCILDRLFHLYFLAKTDSFEQFERWSFKQQYEFNNKVKSDQEFKHRFDPAYEVTQKDKNRYAEICKNPVQWKRPFAEEVAKENKLDFLYKYGYDYASSHVHPLANDGFEDFLFQTKLKDENYSFIDHRVVINNSCLVASMLVQEGLNVSNLVWRAFIYDFLDDFRKYLEDGSADYKMTFYKIGKLGPDTSLCSPKLKK
ncbi:MAG: DUF5677 domain-containing protein [Actinobacteria bacterium]|nr:DUF5677 domain-containing protein [Actinomycetota bacterium]